MSFSVSPCTDPLLFLADLASAYNASSTLEMLKTEKVDFVEKWQNPQNFSEQRHVERYRTIIKRHLKKDGREASSVDCFKKIWSAAQLKVTEKVVQNLMGGSYQEESPSVLPKSEVKVQTHVSSATCLLIVIYKK